MMTDFSSFGIDPKFMKLPKLAGTYSGLLIIASGGRCVWDDLKRAGMAKNHDPLPHVMCVNEMIMFYPGEITHAYSNNHKFLPKWTDTRRDQYQSRYEKKIKTHSNKHGGEYTWPWPGHGTSSLNAVYTGLALGYDRIWLCGVPLDDSGHFWEAPWERTNFVHEVADRDGEIKYWGNAKQKIFEDKVRSFSGRTMNLLGLP